MSEKVSGQILESIPGGTHGRMGRMSLVELLEELPVKLLFEISGGIADIIHDGALAGTPGGVPVRFSGGIPEGAYGDIL